MKSPAPRPQPKPSISTHPSIIALNPRPSSPHIRHRTSPFMHSDLLEARRLFSGSLAGVAYEDANKNLSFDTGEPALANTVVYVDANNNGALDDGEASDVTNDDGTFLLEDLPDGPATLRIAPSTARLESYSFTTIVPTGSGNNNIQLGAADITSPVSGVVFNDANNNSLQESDEGGRPGVTVYLDSNFNEILDAGELSTMTDSDGSYTINGALPGITSVQIVKPSADSVQTTNSLLVLTKNTAVIANPLGLYSPPVTVPPPPPPPPAVTTGTLTGKVFYDANGNGKQDGKDFALKRVAVYLDLNNNKRLDRKDLVTTTDKNGSYTFTKLPAGTYSLRTTTPGFLKPAFSSQSVKITASQTTTAPATPLQFAGFRHLFSFCKAFARMP